MVDEELIDLFSQAHAVELEYLLPEGYTVKDLDIIPCAVYVDDQELPGIYRVGPVKTALTMAKRKHISLVRQEAGHVTWSWS